MQIYRPIYPELKSSSAGAYWSTSLKDIRSFLKYKKIKDINIISAEASEKDLDPGSKTKKKYANKQIEMFKLKPKHRIKFTGIVGYNSDFVTYSNENLDFKLSDLSNIWNETGKSFPVGIYQGVYYVETALGNLLPLVSIIIALKELGHPVYASVQGCSKPIKIYDAGFTELGEEVVRQALENIGQPETYL